MKITRIGENVTKVPDTEKRVGLRLLLLYTYMKSRS